MIPHYFLLSVIALCTTTLNAESSIDTLYTKAHRAKERDNIHDAIVLYQEILTQNPHHTRAQFGLAQCYLTIGDFARGFPLFVYRGPDIPHFTQYNLVRRTLNNTRVLLRAEWGLGDCIQFIRYAELLKKQGATVYVQAYKELTYLLSLCPYIDMVIPVGVPFPEHDMQIPLLSLPQSFNTTVKTIPSTIPYLYPEPHLVALHEYITYQYKKSIGICWSGSGNPHAPAHINKNMPLSIFTSLAQCPGVQLYALQKVSPEHPDYALCKKLNIELLDEGEDECNGNFMDSAARMMHMHAVISIDSTIAHLAGALGRKTYLMLPHKADWRWMRTRDDSPWYPTMKLIRQSSPGDWHHSILNVIKDLEHT